MSHVYFIILLDEFKEYLNEEIKQWQILFTDDLLKTSKLNKLTKYVTDQLNMLALPINGLDNTRKIILSLEEIENNLTDMDKDIQHVVSVYDLLRKYNVAIAPEDERQLDLLIESYNKLKIKVILVGNKIKSQSLLLY